MSGRQLFSKVETVLNYLAAIFRILPKPITKFFWNIFSQGKGHIAIGVRYAIAKAWAKSCGSNVLIGPNVEIKGWKNLELGKNISIHKDCYIDASGGLIIGDDVSIAHQSSILTENHTWDDETLPIKYNPLKAGPVIIDSDVWVGCGARIFADVHIFSRAIVAGGAIVVKNVASKTIVGGNPAKLIKTLSSTVQPLSIPS